MKSAWLTCYFCVLLLERSFASVNGKPNFLLLMVDDLGIGDLGCYGNRTLRTPHVDRLAREGVTLTQHLAAAPLCTPSRAAFLTGRYPIRSGMVGHGRLGVYIFSAASGGLPSQEVTFAKVAKQQGYETALIGKWHLGLNCESSNDHCHHPNVHGFDYFFGIPMTNLRDCQPGHGSVLTRILDHIPYGSLAAVLVAVAFLHSRGIMCVSRRQIKTLVFVVAVAAGLSWSFFVSFRNFNCLLMRNHEVVEQPFLTENLTQRMTKEAVDFLERNSARPFLLFFSFIQVHTALFASAPFQGTSRHGRYGDAVHEVDWSVGQLMETLERLKLRESTLVYLTSDQGPHLEEISASGEVLRGWSGIYKGGKSTNWEGGIRVPGVLSWPGTIPQGRRIDQPTSNMDLFPTVLKLAGAPPQGDREIDGHDLMDLLQERVESSGHEFLFHYCNAYLNAVRWTPQNSTNVWKAFYFTPNFYPENETACFHTLACFCTDAYVTHHDPPLLFDLSRDPSETVPLTPDTEPSFHAVLAAIAGAVERHRASLKPVEGQMTPGRLVWKPWLQPCCSTLAQLCNCQQDEPHDPPATTQGLDQA